MDEVISIIIPVYNNDGSLEKALASVRSQTYLHREIIVVDDGSEVPLKNLGDDVKLVRQENKGAPAARNAGLQVASGAYVIFWDDDVVADPMMLEKMVKALNKDPGRSFAYCNTTFGFKKMPAHSFDSALLRDHNFIHTTSLIKRHCALHWDENLKRFQDWDLWLSMAEQGMTGIWIDEYLFTVKSGGSMSEWLPRFAYKKPWSWLPWIRGKVKRYMEARKVIEQKHSL